MEKNFDPQSAEDLIYSNWQDKQYFLADPNHTGKPFSISMPPPNITGALHMGHALNVTLQDILVRFKRMQGYNTLLLPGTDHASIATEMKIVKTLAEQGLTKQDLGREGFLERAWQWKDEYGGIINNQIKKMGVSADWSRERFTMEESLSQGVEDFFIDLYKKGHIYKGEKLINWCPHCKTTVSDAEVEHIDNQGKIYHMSYQVIGTDERVTFATTRPETLLADVAVAVNPDDERYQHLIGKTALVPIVNREVPIIADSYVDKEFGTGVVKITPGHDFNDNEMGQRHNLPLINVLNDDATINAVGGKFAGMDRYEARKAIVAEFETLGQFVKTEDIANSIGVHDRCETVMEPLLKMQWFVAMEELAKPALKALTDEQLAFVPARFSKIYTHWLENIQDWCISRQLWWGHRIPAYYCGCGHITVGKAITACEKCASTDIKQEEDVLDTWFSSALWPFSTLGWPNETADLAKYFPTDVLVTGPDIIFFWVVRMVFASLSQTGQVPFSDVIIHGIVRDEQGRKMSKNLGNGINPLDIIEEYGTDALRLTLVIGSSLGADQRFSTSKVLANRNFLNKIWNATRFIQMNDPDGFGQTLGAAPSELNLEDKWLLDKLDTLIAEVTANMDNYDFGIALQKIYDFAWDEYCDWYIEMAKPSLRDASKKTATIWTLKHVLVNILKLLHPYAPFITEEIFTHIQSSEDTIVLSMWPKVGGVTYPTQAKTIEDTKDIIREIRNIRRDMNVEPAKKITIAIVTDAANQTAFEQTQLYFAPLAIAERVVVQTDITGISDKAVAITAPNATIYLDGLLDIDKEIKRLEKELDKLGKEISRSKGMLGNADFVAKAPEKMINAEKEKQQTNEALLAKVQANLDSLRA